MAGAAKTSDPAVEIEQATRDIANYMQTVNRSLQIAVDEELGSTIITVTDRATEQVVRQIPSKDAVELARYLVRQQSELAGSELPTRGILIDRKS